MKHYRVVFAVLALFAVAACSDDEGDHHSPGSSGSGGHDSPYPTCKAIIAECHPVDVGEGPIHDCHDLAHDAKSDSDCTPKHDECIAICAAAKADAGSDSGH